ncbi:hypothetical protein AHAS_Ahas01G0231200 [Arachis hypogaea]
MISIATFYPFNPVQPLPRLHSLDYESKLAKEFIVSQRLKIAIIGFGKFGQFLATTLVRQGHTVLVHSRSDHSIAAKKLGVSFFQNPDDLCEEHPEVILLCSSIISMERVLLTLPLQRLKRSTLFVDVFSVKEFPKKLLLELLHSDFDILCTHPMFGPESASDGWTGLPFVFERVRILDEEHRVSRCEKFLNAFAREGCRMVEMSCEDHDRYAVGSQFITHTVGRILKGLMLESTPINTKGYESLLGLVENTARDSFDLYYGLFMFNKNSLEMLEKLDLAFEDLKKQLIARLHRGVRNQLIENGERLHQRDGSNSHALLRRAPNEFALLHSSFNDVALLSSFASNNSSQSDENTKLKIAIVGFGNFGQFLAKTIVSQGHEVWRILDQTTLMWLKSWGFRISATLKRSTLFVDVLSVKEFPRNLFLQHLPHDFDVLCTHPMFGPESGKNGWKNLPLVYDKVRIGNEKSRILRCYRFLDIFASEGCWMVEMSCAEHDRHAAGSQFVTHTTGRFLEKLGLKTTPINTNGYETLLSLVKNTVRDSFDLYYGLFLYNLNAMEQLERFDLAFESLKKQLFNRLHSIY